MPSEKVLKQKQGIVAELAKKLEAATSGVLVDYKGVNVGDDTKLRKEMREAGVDYSVVKNTLLRRAAEMAGIEGLDSFLEGTTALALSTEDAITPAKILCKFADTKKDFFHVKVGFVEGKAISADEVNALAKLPSKEELVAKMLAGFNAPISGFVNVLNGNLRGLAIVLNAIAEKQSA